MTIDELLKKMGTARPETSLDLVKKAYSYALEAHSGQLRESGEPYVEHPLATAIILAELQLDPATIVAALLHDVVEDTHTTVKDIASTFGDEVALLVDGVTKLSKLDFKTREEQQAESLRKMFVAMAKDIRVLLIKLADRLHNMRTLRHSPPDKQKRVAKETLEIYSPLAHRLGIWRLKWELEDLALRYLEPKAYYELVDRVAKKRLERESFIEEARRVLDMTLAELGISAELQGRPKHFYSIYHKMTEQGKDFGEIWDLMGMRVIVDTVRECYAVLGAVHSIWKPIPGKFKDYIAMPKSNMYQSLHTTVIGPRGEPLEIQIRTVEMHRTAEYGIAAHWRYKENISPDGEFDEKITWLRQMLEWQQETRDVQEFMETLRIDLFSDEVYVFTPKGDVKALPAGATPIDFAYAVHTDIGHRCVGARVNAKMVPLDTTLQTGDIVEILTNKSLAGPSQDWLSIAKTSKARTKIRQWIKEQRKEEKVARGRELLEKELRRIGAEVHANMKDERLIEVAKRFYYQNIEDLFANMGYGRLSPQAVVSRLLPDKAVEEPKIQVTKRRSKASRGVVVRGVDNVLVRFSKCCSPVPDDAITGYITRGRGVSIHRSDCPTVLSILTDEPERKVDVEWDRTDRSSYPVGIEIEATDRPGLLTGVMTAISEMNTHVSAVNARTTRNRHALINMVLEINDVGHMNNVIKRLRRVSGVHEVHRSTPS